MAGKIHRNIEHHEYLANTDQWYKAYALYIVDTWLGQEYLQNHKEVKTIQKTQLGIAAWHRFKNCVLCDLQWIITKQNKNNKDSLTGFELAKWFFFLSALCCFWGSLICFLITTPISQKDDQSSGTNLINSWSLGKIFNLKIMIMPELSALISYKPELSASYENRTIPYMVSSMNFVSGCWSKNMGSNMARSWEAIPPIMRSPAW